MPYIFITNSMKLKSLIALIFALCLFQPQLIEAQKKRSLKKTANTNLTARQIADKVLPSVVLIITQDENDKPISQGSGFVIGQGLVVSNLHVFERATKAIVKNVKTGEISKAIEVVRMNAKEDICVIRIDNAKFPVLPLGDSSSIQTGDEIYVASNPKGLEGSFTKGIVSSLRTDVGLFQIDAAISPGSSGGVLLNQKAEAVGIIKSSLVSGQNLNFAIPINKLKALKYIFKHSIQLAGACAYRDKEKEKLKGLVKKVVEKSPHNRIENGRLIEDGILVDSIHIYDLDGNEIETTVNQVDGKLAWKFNFTYDENRLKTSYVREFYGGSITQEKFDLENGIYNKLYNRKFSGSFGDKDKPGGMQVFNSDGEVIEWYIGAKKITYTYDLEGRPIESIQWGKNKVEIKKRFSYKDDKYGNWIEKYEEDYFPYVDNDWHEAETNYREITYYE